MYNLPQQQACNLGSEAMTLKFNRAKTKPLYDLCIEDPSARVNIMEFYRL